MTPTPLKLVTAILGICLLATSAQADLVVDFSESAPKDRFTIKNDSACDLGPATITVNLAGSAGELFFDTSGAGAGVEVFQPYETVEGATHLKSASVVGDGDTRVSLRLNGLPANMAVGFTIDVDDRLENSARGQIIVTGSEISGASVSLEMANLTPITASFEEESSATMKTEGCVF